MAEEIGLRAVIDLSNFNKGVKQYNAGIGKMDKKTSSLASAATGSFSKIGSSLATVGAIAGGAALAGVAALATGVGVLGVASVNTAISFESAFAGVTKTTDGLTSGIGVLNEEGLKLRQGFVDLSKEVPLAFEELAGIGELGGQLGIGKDALLDFTQTIAALGVSTNLSTEEAATAIARMGNIYQVKASDMGMNTQQVGSAIVALGNNFATTERDITNFATRIAGAGQISGLSQADILGIGAAFSSVGVEAEAGGTAVQKVLLDMNNAVNGAATGFVDNTAAIENNVGRLQDLNAESARLEASSPGLQQAMLDQYDAFIATGGSAEEFGRQLGDKTRQEAFETATAIRDLEQQTQLLRQSQGQPIDAGQLQTFAKVAGVSADEFSALWEKDASQAFQLFVEGLGKEGDNAANILDELGLADQRLIKAFLSLSGAGDLLGDAIDTSNKAFEDNTALQNEAAQRYATTESQIAILKNTLRAAGDAIGSRFLPFVNRLISVGKNLIDKWADPLANILDKKVIPAIDNLINLFKSGGLESLLTGGFLGEVGWGGVQVEGLLDILGLSPENQAVALDVINRIIAGVKNVGNAISALMVGNTSGFLTALGLTPEMASQIMTIGNSIVSTITTIVSMVTTAISALSAGDTGGFLLALGLTPETAATILTIGEVIKGVFNGIVAVVMQSFGSLQGSFSEITAILNKFGYDWGDVFTALGMATGIVLTAIGALIVGLVGIISGAFNGIAAVIQSLIDNFNRIWIAIEVAITGIAQIFVGFQQIIDNFGTDWFAVWNGVQMVMIGIVNTFSGIFSAMLQIIMVPLNAATAFISGWVEGIITFFTTLYNTLIGHSIIPDLVNGIISWFNFLTEPILTVLDTISGAISTVLGPLLSLFSGGGEQEGGIGFSLASLIEQFPVATEAANLFWENLTLQTTAFLEGVWLTLETRFNNLIIITLPQLQTTYMTVFQQMISVTLQLISIVIQLVNYIIMIGTEVKKAGEAVKKAAKEMAEGFKDAADSIEKNLFPTISELIKMLERVENRAHSAGAAISSMKQGGISGAAGSNGIGLKKGIGLQGGLGLGYKIPSGYPNDSFGPLYVQSGEEMLVTPRGTSIEGLVFSRLASLLSDSVRGGSVNGGKSVQVNFNAPISITSGMDWDTFQAGVRRTVAGAF